MFHFNDIHADDEPYLRSYCNLPLSLGLPGEINTYGIPQEILEKIASVDMYAKQGKDDAYRAWETDLQLSS